jgi:uncharacterized protein YhbP (UPF0306 family)
MNDQQVETMIREYIPGTVHMSLGTSRDNKPWVCEVHFAYDDDLNIYFVSSKDTRHALEITDNSRVAGNIVTQHANGDKVRGIYFEGTAEVLENVTADSVGVQSYVDRLGANWLLEAIKKDGGPGLFKISVENFYVFDDREAQRGKFQLKWGKQ